MKGRLVLLFLLLVGTKICEGCWFVSFAAPAPQPRIIDLQGEWNTERAVSNLATLSVSGCKEDVCKVKFSRTLQTMDPADTERILSLNTTEDVEGTLRITSSRAGEIEASGGSRFLFPNRTPLLEYRMKGTFRWNVNHTLTLELEEDEVKFTYILRRKNMWGSTRRATNDVLETGEILTLEVEAQDRTQESLRREETLISTEPQVSEVLLLSPTSAGESSECSESSSCISINR